MSNDCLLLNGNGKPLSYFPLSTIDWKTSIKLVLTKNVIIIKNHDDWVVRSPSVTVDVPSIIMLRRFHKFQNYVKFSRSNVYLRDMYKCQYCSDIFERNRLTLDHVVPKSKGLLILELHGQVLNGFFQKYQSNTDICTYLSNKHLIVKILRSSEIYEIFAAAKIS